MEWTRPLLSALWVSTSSNQGIFHRDPKGQLFCLGTLLGKGGSNPLRTPIIQKYLAQNGSKDSDRLPRRTWVLVRGQGSYNMKNGRELLQDGWKEKWRGIRGCLHHPGCSKISSRLEMFPTYISCTCFVSKADSVNAIIAKCGWL